LPIEISTRGAKFADEADESTVLTQAFIEETERTADTLAEGLAAAKFDIERLEDTPKRDNT
jgi:hypothetical protein